MEARSQNEVTIIDSTLRCELITNFSRLEDLSAEWQRLFDADPTAEIFQSFAWARAWWRCYGDHVVLRTLAVFEGERMIGIIPLVKEGDRIVFLGGTHADYCDILSEEGRAAEVFQTALETLLQVPDWNECVLRNLKVGGQIFNCLATLPKRLRRHLQTVPCEDCHTILLGENRDVLVSLLGKEHTKRRIKKLRKAGALTFRHIETRAEAQAQLSDFFRHHTRRRALAGKEGSTPEFINLMRNLIDELDLSKELRFGVLALNDHPLAWHVSFHVNGKLLFYQQTFDVDMWEYSPGEVLMHELLLYAQGSVSREFDFTRGNEPFKDRFTTHLQESYSLYIERSGIVGLLRRVWRACEIPWLRIGRHTQSLAKRHDRTFHAFRSVRLWTSGALARIHYHRKEGTLVRWAVNSVAPLFRSMRFSRTDVDLYPPDGAKGDATGFSVGSNSNLSVREGGLGDMVDLALQHPEIVVPYELSKYRQRLRKGDHVYLVRQGEEVMLVGWTTIRTRNEILPPSQHASADGPMMLLYECWPVSNVLDNVYYRQLLSAISKEAEKNRAVLGVSCADKVPGLKSEVKR